MNSWRKEHQSSKKMLNLTRTDEEKSTQEAMEMAQEAIEALFVQFREHGRSPGEESDGSMRGERHR